ncbi:hypothetical protein CJJ09_005617 [Candidozyma auris]|nr:hypothetical protein CJJ09_005617 [[Candida] auris]
MPDESNAKSLWSMYKNAKTFFQTEQPLPHPGALAAAFAQPPRPTRQQQGRGCCCRCFCTDPGHEEFDYVAHIRRIGRDYENTSSSCGRLPSKPSSSSGKAGSVSSDASRKRPNPFSPVVQPVATAVGGVHSNLSAALKENPGQQSSLGFDADHPMDFASDHGLPSRSTH